VSADFKTAKLQGLQSVVAVIKLFGTFVEYYMDGERKLEV
jgi:hypothetical protein